MLAWAPLAGADVLTPEDGGSPNADSIDLLYKVTLAIGFVIFVGVEGALLYSLVKHRFRRRAPEPAQIRGNTPLEIGWTAGAAAIVLFLFVLTLFFLPVIQVPEASGPGGLASARSPAGAPGSQYAAVGQPEPPGGRKLEIGVNGQQYIWRYDYPGPGPLFSYHEMVVPTDTTVTLTITSQDVAHSWWIPKLGGKVDALPGHVGETWFKIKEPGVYTGQCAELCGQGHADQTAQVRAVPPAEFSAWAARQTEDIKASQVALATARRQPGDQGDE